MNSKNSMQKKNELQCNTDIFMQISLQQIALKMAFVSDELTRKLKQINLLQYLCNLIS